jgi:chromosome segregation ATPase
MKRFVHQFEDYSQSRNNQLRRYVNHVWLNGGARTKQTARRSLPYPPTTRLPTRDPGNNRIITNQNQNRRNQVRTHTQLYQQRHLSSQPRQRQPVADSSDSSEEDDAETIESIRTTAIQSNRKTKRPSEYLNSSKIQKRVTPEAERRFKEAQAEFSKLNQSYNALRSEIDKKEQELTLLRTRFSTVSDQLRTAMEAKRKASQEFTESIPQNNGVDSDVDSYSDSDSD